MGYYTDFTLKVTPPFNSENEVSDFNETFTRLTDYEFENDFTMYGVKWYDHDKNMLTLSRTYPDRLFQLDGVGEEHDDVWRTYYKDGKSHDAEVITTYEPYDESKLK